MMDEAPKTVLAFRTSVIESAVTSEGPDEIRTYIMIGKTAMFVDTMSTMLPITTPFREIRFIRRLTLRDRQQLYPGDAESKKPHPHQRMANVR
jgi:hypothetical protein